jgi:FRG domain
MIRDFRRKYRADDQTLVGLDTLYCLSVMQHYGAPTRLLDWTYSPFAAAKFAIESGYKKDDGEQERRPVIWCLNAEWCSDASTNIVPALKKRNSDKRRNDGTFAEIYLRNGKRFIGVENALQLNERLTIQQGVFLCPGDIASSFVCNLRSLNGWESDANVVQLELKMNKEQFREFARWIRRMNVSSATLFPGIDGFARSFGEHIFHFEQ